MTKTILGLDFVKIKGDRKNLPIEAIHSTLLIIKYYIESMRLIKEISIRIWSSYATSLDLVDQLTSRLVLFLDANINIIIKRV